MGTTNEPSSQQTSTLSAYSWAYTGLNTTCEQHQHHGSQHDRVPLASSHNQERVPWCMLSTPGDVHQAAALHGARLQVADSDWLVEEVCCSRAGKLTLRLQLIPGLSLMVCGKSMLNTLVCVSL